jgi:acyl phosphate:glycerol-3-phosphate acyltransferase
MDFASKVVLAWLLGSLVGSLILGRLRGGPDIRSLGSGNAGSTNAWRTRGAAFGLGVFVIDAGKGWLAVRALAPAAPGWSSLGPAFRPSPLLAPWLPVACAAAAVAGHVYPVWFGLRGGKGLATLIGALGALAPLLLVPLAIAWLVVFSISGFVGLASMASVATAAAWQALTAASAPLTVFLLAATAFMIFTHRANIARMRAGTEPRRSSK